MELHILNEDTLDEADWEDGLDQTYVKIDNGELSNLEYTQLDNEVLSLNKTDTETSGEDDSGDDTSGDEDSEAWTMFMAHLNFNEYDAIEKEIQKLGVPYIIAFECSPYDHFHFMVRITEKNYYNFCKRVFKDKYKLRGRATKGLPKQYGHMAKKIESLDKIAKYTIKDKNYRTNMSKKKLEKIIKCKVEEVKNIKADQKALKDKALEFVEANWDEWSERIKFNSKFNSIEGYGHSSHFIPGTNERLLIIHFMMENKIPIRKTTIESYYYHIVVNSTLKGIKRSAINIFRELYEP